MTVYVSDVLYLENYSVKVIFNASHARVVDLKNEIEEGVFKPLKDINFFKTFHIDHHTVEWENGADFAPEYLYLLSKPFKKEETQEEKDLMRYVKSLYEKAS